MNPVSIFISGRATGAWTILNWVATVTTTETHRMITSAVYHTVADEISFIYERAVMNTYQNG